MSRRRQSSKRTADGYTKRARREGFAARSVFKLEEIDRRLGLLRAGQNVLDLGAVPGSWTQYAAKRVGKTGSVFGVDITAFEGSLPPNARIVQGDLRELDMVLSTEGILASAPKRFDVVLSDMAPPTSGQRQADMYRSFELAMAALDVARARLVARGAFVAKIFQGPEYEDARNRVRESFETVRTIRPKATRNESYEVFLVGLGKRE